jgi:hypothetical protein
LSLQHKSKFTQSLKEANLEDLFCLILNLQGCKDIISSMALSWLMYLYH